MLDRKEKMAFFKFSEFNRTNSIFDRIWNQTPSQLKVNLVTKILPKENKSTNMKRSTLAPNCKDGAKRFSNLKALSPQPRGRFTLNRNIEFKVKESMSNINL